MPSNLEKIVIIVATIAIEGLIIWIVLFDWFLPQVTNEVAKSILVVGVPAAVLGADIWALVKLL